MDLPVISYILKSVTIAEDVILGPCFFRANSMCLYGIYVFVKCCHLLL